jgi:hypothetical protein
MSPKSFNANAQTALACEVSHAFMHFSMVALGHFLRNGSRLRSAHTGKPAQFPMGLAAGICVLVESCYLAFGRWRVSLAYLLLATTYAALTAGATITAFNITRYLFD